MFVFGDEILILTYATFEVSRSGEEIGRRIQLIQATDKAFMNSVAQGLWGETEMFLSHVVIRIRTKNSV
jgi:hypothetical protein